MGAEGGAQIHIDFLTILLRSFCILKRFRTQQNGNKTKGRQGTQGSRRSKERRRKACGNGAKTLTIFLEYLFVFIL